VRRREVVVEAEAFADHVERPTLHFFEDARDVLALDAVRDHQQAVEEQQHDEQ